MSTRRHWITVLLGSMALLMLLTASVSAGPADPPDGEFHLLVEVAHPRGAIISDTQGAVENFAHGDGRTVYVMAGEVIRFKSGFGYEGVWYADATGTLGTWLSVYRVEAGGELTSLGEDGSEVERTGPHIESGSADVDVAFNEPGTFDILSRILSTAHPVAQVADVLIQDEDEVTTHVVVLDPAQLGSISGTVTDEETGDPIPAVLVIAGNPETQFHRRARTDDQGHYTITGLMEGEYVVGAVGQRQGYLSEFYDNTRRREEATPVAVTAGSETSGIDFALTRAERSAGTAQDHLPEALLGLADDDDAARPRPDDVPQDDSDLLHEVAHPRAAVAGAVGAAENFDHGNGHTITVRQGTTVRFKSGFGYEGVWFQGAGVITFGIEVCVVQDGECTPTGRDVDVHRGRAPRIQHGSVYVDVTFDRPGTFEVRSRVLTMVRPATDTPVGDEDVVTTFVRVVPAEEQPADSVTFCAGGTPGGGVRPGEEVSG